MIPVGEDKCGPCYRVVAMKDFGNVRAGDIGGIVHSAKNLSQDGNCWIGVGVVIEDAHSRVAGDSVVLGCCTIRGGSRICGNVVIDSKCNQIVIERKSSIDGDVHITGECHFDCSSITRCGKVKIDSSRFVCSRLYYADTLTINDVTLDDVRVRGNSVIEHATLNKCEVYGVEIYGPVRLIDCWLELCNLDLSKEAGLDPTFNKAAIGYNAYIRKVEDVFTFRNNFDKTDLAGTNDPITAFRTKAGNIRVTLTEPDSAKLLENCKPSDFGCTEEEFERIISMIKNGLGAV